MAAISLPAPPWLIDVAAQSLTYMNKKQHNRSKPLLPSAIVTASRSWQVTVKREQADDTAKTAPRVPARARRARLAEIIGREGFVSVGDTADLLGVSGMTIRRDLEALESRGLLTRTHGGAIAPEIRRREVFDAEEPVFERRKRKNAEAKAR